MNLRRTTGLVASLLVVMLVVGCKHPSRQHPLAKTSYDPWAEDAVKSLLWTQRSAEYQALCYQAFNTASDRLKEALARNTNNLKLAVVVDIDETLVDNSPYRAQLIRNSQDFSTNTWEAWVNRAEAEALPGAVEFLKLANEKNVRVFYISNRNTAREQQATLKNLQALGFPQLLPEQLLLSRGTSKKERRQTVKNLGYEIVLLLGDNLADLEAAFEEAPSAERNSLAPQFKEEWGRKFVVLPNALYGDWENSLYKAKNAVSPEEKARLRRNSLRGPGEPADR